MNTVEQEREKLPKLPIFFWKNLKNNFFISCNETTFHVYFIVYLYNIVYLFMVYCILYVLYLCIAGLEGACTVDDVLQLLQILYAISMEQRQIEDLGMI